MQICQQNSSSTTAALLYHVGKLRHPVNLNYFPYTVLEIVYFSFCTLKEWGVSLV